MTDEVDIINHLLDIEHESSELLLDAQKEADNRTAAARAKAEAQFKSEYDKKSAEIEKKEEAEREKIQLTYNHNFAKFKEHLQDLVRDKEAFAKEFEPYLFA